MYKHQVYRSIVAMRGVLTTMIYDATLEMPSDMIDETAALTLMNTDIERIAFGMQYMHEVWASTIEVAIAIYLLERQVGVASVVPGIIVLCELCPRYRCLGLLVTNSGFSIFCSCSPNR